MSDEQLSPAEEEVRRLLADARHTEPMPPEVVARMDRVLAGLSTEPVRTATVTDLATRRRRVAGLLVAAAAVVVVGIGLGQVLGSGFSGGDADQATSADEAAAPEAGQDADRQGDRGAGADEPGTTSSETARGAANGLELERLRPDSLRRDAMSLASSYAVTDNHAEVPELHAYLDSADLAVGTICRTDAWGSGTFVPVRYGRTPAVLVLRKPQGATRVADVYLCGSTAPIRSVTLPAP